MKSLAIGLSLLACGQVLAASDLKCEIHKRIVTSEAFIAESKEVKVIKPNESLEGVFRISKTELKNFKWATTYHNLVFGQAVADDQEKMLKATKKYLASNDLDQNVKIVYKVENNTVNGETIYLRSSTSESSSSECYRGSNCYAGYATNYHDISRLVNSTGTGTAMTSAFTAPTSHRDVFIDLDMRISCQVQAAN